MDKRELNKLVRAAGRMLLALGFVFSQTAWAAQSQNQKENPKPAREAGAQSPVKASPPAPAKAETEAAESTAKQSAADETASRGGPHEGIRVHGHWTIEVRNPDGTLATHREFENSYFPGNGLASILARQASIGYWVVVLSLSTNACVNGGSNSCGIYEAGYGVSGPDGLLTVGTSGNNLILSGTMTAPSASSVLKVQTLQYACPPTVAPATSCPLAINNIFTFTATGLAAPVVFSAGQTIAVTVNISFS